MFKQRFQDNRQDLGLAEGWSLSIDRRRYWPSGRVVTINRKKKILKGGHYQ